MWTLSLSPDWHAFNRITITQMAKTTSVHPRGTCDWYKTNPPLLQSKQNKRSRKMIDISILTKSCSGEWDSASSWLPSDDDLSHKARRQTSSGVPHHTTPGINLLLDIPYLISLAPRDIWDCEFEMSIQLIRSKSVKSELNHMKLMISWSHTL